MHHRRRRVVVVVVVTHSLLMSHELAPIVDARDTTCEIERDPPSAIREAVVLVVKEIVDLEDVDDAWITGGLISHRSDARSRIVVSHDAQLILLEAARRLREQELQAFGHFRCRGERVKVSKERTALRRRLPSTHHRAAKARPVVVADRRRISAGDATVRAGAAPAIKHNGATYGDEHELGILLLVLDLVGTADMGLEHVFSLVSSRVRWVGCGTDGTVGIVRFGGQW